MIVFTNANRGRNKMLSCVLIRYEEKGATISVNWLLFIERNRNFSLKYEKSKASVNSGAPSGSVPQNICSSGQFSLAGRFGKNNMSLEVKCCWEILPYDYTLIGQWCLLGNLLAGNSSISLAGSGEQINVSQQSPKMLKMALESFFHALLLFLGLFLKISLWVPLNVDLTKPLAKYAGEHCPVLLPLYAALLIFLILEFSDFPGRVTYSILKQYVPFIHLLNKKYLG